MSYRVGFSRSARRRISEDLPEAVAAAVMEFCLGPLSENPKRVGKRLSGRLSDRYGARRGTYRVIYILDEEEQTVLVTDVDHRRDVYHFG